MGTLDRLAQAAIHGEGLAVRSLAQDLLREFPRLERAPPPETQDPLLLAAAAALVELLAARLGQPPPPWSAGAPIAPQPIFLLRAAERMKHLRALCVAQAPEPLRRRGFYAPPNFLEFA